MSKPVRALLIGAAGRMGKTIVDLAKRDPNIDIVNQCDLGDAVEPVMKNCDVAIDFSQADAIAEICRGSNSASASARRRHDRSFTGAETVNRNDGAVLADRFCIKF